MRLTDDLRRAVKREINNLLATYTSSMPFPVEHESVYMLYRELYPDKKALEATDYLHNRGLEVSRVIKGYLDVSHVYEDREDIRVSKYRVKFDFDNWYPCPKGLPFTLTEELLNYEAIATWAHDAYKFNRKAIAVKNTFEFYLAHCNTTGQLVRLLGNDIAPLFPNEIQQSIRAYKRLARLPEGLLELRQYQHHELMPINELSELMAYCMLYKHYEPNPIWVVESL